ncbi:MAG TPA: EamA family transporter [Thermoanaerobaculia bacterium]|nr:EamA family transporter [Thermoanaerobaculia bacterium]
MTRVSPSPVPGSAGVPIEPERRRPGARATLLDRPPSRSVALALCGLLALIWGTTWSVIRVGLEGIPPFAGVALRFGLAGTLLFGVARWARAPLGVSGGKWRLVALHGVASFCVSYGVTYWAEQWVPSGLTALLFATFPLWVNLLAFPVLPAERPTAIGLTGVAAGFAGVVVLFSQDFEVLGGRQVLIASAVMLLAPLSTAFSNVAIKRWGRGLHPVSLNAWSMTLAAAIMGALARLLEQGRPLVLDGPSVGSVLYLAVIGSALTFTIYFWLLRHLPATRLALISYAVPVVAVAIGALAFAEPVTARTVAGGLLVMAGIGLASR